MQRSAASAIGVNHSRSFGKTEWLIRLTKKNYHWNCPMLNLTNPDPKEKGLWQIFLNGFINTPPPPGQVGRGPWKLIRCQGMQARRGTSFAIWIPTMKKNFVTGNTPIIGARLISISVERNMLLVIYCTVAC